MRGPGRSPYEPERLEDDVEFENLDTEELEEFSSGFEDRAENYFDQYENEEPWSGG